MSAASPMSGRHVLLALAVVLVWALNFLVIRIGLNDLPPLCFAGLRFALTAFPAVLLLGRGAMPWRLILGAGTCIGVGYFSLLFVGMHLGVAPGFAALVSQGQVVFTAFFAMGLLREIPTRWQAIGMAVAVAGLLLAGLDHLAAADSLGLVLVVVAALFWGLGNVLIRHLGRGIRVDGFRLVVWMSLVPPVPNLLLSAWLEQGQWAHLTQISSIGVLALLYTAFGSTLFGWGAWSWLLRRYAAPQVAPFSLLVPVVALCMSMVWMDEAVSMRLAIASVLLLAGVGLTLFEPLLAARVAWPRFAGRAAASATRR
jgi:O-acetylserine/cysteine efflux transporter